MTHRRQPRWLVILVSAALLPALGGALVGLALTAYTGVERTLVNSGTAPMLDFPSEAVITIAYSTGLGLILGAPVVSVLLLIGHFFTQRRPVDGLWVGAMGGAVLTGVSALILDTAFIWFGLAILPVAAFLGQELCRFGYRPAKDTAPDGLG